MQKSAPLDLLELHAGKGPRSACDRADQRLVAVARKFDPILCLSPTNVPAAMERWFNNGAEGCPDLKYRELDFEPADLRHELHAIELTHISEPLIEGLLLEKRHELDVQLTLLEKRNTPEFRGASEQLYGRVSGELHSAAKEILARIDVGDTDHDSVGAEQLQSHARDLIEHYVRKESAFAPEIEIRDDVTGLLVSYPSLFIDRTEKVSTNRVDPLLSHELSIHMLTAFNGACQKLNIFSIGLAGYEEIQEGLGIFAEWAVGGLNRSRLRLIAGRVIAVKAMLEGADFTECFRLMVDQCGISRHRAFKLAARVYRSGGLAKDAIYLRGFLRVMELIAKEGDLSPFWIGKIAPVHVPIVNLLVDQDWLSAPRLIPEFLEREEVKKRISLYRGNPSASHWL